MELCIDVEASLDNVYEEASLLTRYGVIPRYPTEIELIEQDAKTALEYADKVTEFVKKLLCKT